MEQLDILQLYLQVDTQAKFNPQGFRLSIDEQKQLAKRNGFYEKALKSEDEVQDIVSLAKDNPNDYTFKNITVTEFKQYYDALRIYSVNQIGRSLNKIGIEQAPPAKIDGIPQRLRLLPVPLSLYTDK